MEKKEKKKFPLSIDSPFVKVGIMFREDIPEFHIDCVECTEEEYNENLAAAIAGANVWLKSPVLKKRIKERNIKRNIK